MEPNEKETRTRLIAYICSCREIANYVRVPYLIHLHEILNDTIDHSLRSTDIIVKVPVDPEECTLDSEDLIISLPLKEMQFIAIVISYYHLINWTTPITNGINHSFCPDHYCIIHVVFIKFSHYWMIAVTKHN